MSTLADILAHKRREADHLRRRQAKDRPTEWPVRSVLDTLKRAPGDRLKLIAEIKRRSPSAGPLDTTLDVPERAAAYVRGGASMLSVLCDETFFGGGFDHLAHARRTVAVPLLCKDFVIDPVQLERAWEAGADAALLIVRCLSDGEHLRELVDGAIALGLEPFVEVFNEAELERALRAGARLVGVNARDLDTLAMDSARATRVLAEIPDGIAAVHLSGLRTPDDVRQIGTSRADAALIGEVLMRTSNPEPLIRALCAAAH